MFRYLRLEYGLTPPKGGSHVDTLLSRILESLTDTLDSSSPSRNRS